MSHTYRKTITFYCLVSSQPHRERVGVVKRGKKYGFDIAGSFFYQETWFWNRRLAWWPFFSGTDPTVSTQAGNPEMTFLQKIKK